MHILDDVTLIQQFVGGEATLAANQNLRIEPAFDSLQLLAKRGGLIASMKRVGSRQTVLMRRESDYAALMHQILLARQFVPAAGASNQPDFEQYRADEIPAGYEVSYTTVRTLWREWWRSTRHTNVNNIQIDLLIFVRDTWYPVRNIVCSEGVLFITTLVSEVSYEGSEPLTWLRRVPAPQTATAEPLTTLLPDRLHPPISKPIALQPPTADREPRSNVSTPSSLNNKRGQLDSEPSHPDLRKVLRFCQGKLYITTALGEIVVEGSQLKYRLDEANLTIAPQKLINLHGYRDREGQAASL